MPRHAVVRMLLLLPGCCCCSVRQAWLHAPPSLHACCMPAAPRIRPAAHCRLPPKLQLPPVCTLQTPRLHVLPSPVLHAACRLRGCTPAPPLHAPVPIPRQLACGSMRHTASERTFRLERRAWVFCDERLITCSARGAGRRRNRFEQRRRQRRPWRRQESSKQRLGGPAAPPSRSATLLHPPRCKACRCRHTGGLGRSLLRRAAAGGRRRRTFRGSLLRPHTRAWP